MKALKRIQDSIARQHLVVVDELGYAPFSKAGAELLFEFFSRRYERGGRRTAAHAGCEGQGTATGPKRCRSMT